MSSTTLQAEFFEPGLVLQADMGSKQRNQPSPPDDTKSKITELTREQSWLKGVSWKIATVYAAAFIGLITWYLPKELNQLREAVKGDTSVTIQPLDTRLSKVEGQLQTLIDFQKQISLKDIARQDQESFPKSLPVLRNLAENPPSDQFKPDPSTLREIAEKLQRTDESSPDYWPTVLQFLKFASAIVAPTNVPPPGPSFMFSGVTAPRSQIRGRVVILDGGDFRDSVFLTCRVIFTENSVNLKGVHFINCVFELPVTDSPSPFLKQASQTLLASDLLSVVMNISG
jgi:hypothetical protein